VLVRGIGQQAKELTSEEANQHPGAGTTGIPRPHKSMGQQEYVTSIQRKNDSIKHFNKDMKSFI
jgi:hypothetical protein